MKKILFYLFLFGIIHSSYAQSDCIVKYNSGKVFVNGKLLKKFDVFKHSDTLVFTNPKGVLKFCHSNCRINDIILGDNLNKTKLKSVQYYGNYRVKLTSRNNIVLTTSNLFTISSNKFGLGVIDTLKIPISDKYIINEKNLFLMSFRIKGIENNRQIPIKNNELLISKHLTLIDNEYADIDKDSLFTLLYYQTINDTNDYLVKNIDIKFISKSSVYNDLEKTINDKVLTTNDKIEIITNYLIIKYPNYTFSKQNILNILK